MDLTPRYLARDLNRTYIVTATVLKIDPRCRKVWVDQEDPQPLNRPDTLKNNVIVSCALHARCSEPNQMTTPDACALSAYLRNDHTQDLLDTIIDQHRLSDDGRGGRLTTKGQNALGQLVAGIEALPKRTYTLHRVARWVDENLETDYIGVLTDQEIGEIVEEAVRAGRIFEDDLHAYLVEMRDRSR